MDLSEDADKELSLESFEDKLWLFSKESGEVPRPHGHVVSDICERLKIEFVFILKAISKSSCLLDDIKDVSES